MAQSLHASETCAAVIGYCSWKAGTRGTRHRVCEWTDAHTNCLHSYMLGLRAFSRPWVKLNSQVLFVRRSVIGVETRKCVLDLMLGSFLDTTVLVSWVRGCVV
jgi:hypothetical protein